jgi:hypothetical protein
MLTCGIHRYIHANWRAAHVRDIEHDRRPLLFRPSKVHRRRLPVAQYVAEIAQLIWRRVDRVHIRELGLGDRELSESSIRHEVSQVLGSLVEHSPDARIAGVGGTGDLAPVDRQAVVLQLKE